MSAVYTPTRYKLSIEDYRKLGEVGILSADSRVELIEGEIIQMAPIGVSHLWAVTRLTRFLMQAVGTRAEVSPQNAIVLPPDSVPQPDFTLLRVPVPGKALRVPLPEDVILVVEVSDTTLRYDRGTKLRLYAQAGIAQYWIVDANKQRIENYGDPADGTYRKKSMHERGDTVAIAQLPGAIVAVSDVFPDS